MNYSGQMKGGTPEELESMLMPRVDTSEIGAETDREKVNAIVFELYKEAASIVNMAAHLLDDVAFHKGGWPRNQAICAGLMIRITKFMIVVAQLSAERNRAEVVFALSRSIMESAINLEFLLRKSEDRYFDQFVEFSLGPERELYDIIQSNIAARRGEVWPIEQRMLDSINDVCGASGVKIGELKQRYGDWGGGVRERLKALDKEHRYTGMARLPSHAVHGTWVDLYKNHLKYDSGSAVFSPDPQFSDVDARHLGPVAIFILEAVRPYVESFFSGVPESKLVLERTDDLTNRLLEADAAHERLMSKE